MLFLLTVLNGWSVEICFGPQASCWMSFLTNGVHRIRWPNLWRDDKRRIETTVYGWLFCPLYRFIFHCYWKGGKKKMKNDKIKAKTIKDKEKNDATFLLGLFSLTGTNISSHWNLMQLCCSCLAGPSDRAPKTQRIPTLMLGNNANVRASGWI